MRLADGTRKFVGVLDIPAATFGTYKIRKVARPAGRFDLYTKRTHLLGGQKALCVDVPFKTYWHELSYEGGVWMTDLPVEQEQHDNLLAPMLSGTVLVGGLGLGYAAHVLACRRGIRRVVVVEKAPEVIALAEAALRRNLSPTAQAKVSVVCADLHEYLASYSGAPFTWAFYDIWQMDSESTFFDTVVPLLRASADKVKNRPACWNEDVMRGQLMFDLMGRLHPFPGQPGPEVYATPVEGEYAKWHNWRVPFFEWFVSSGATVQEGADLARLYADLYESGPAWLEMWRAKAKGGEPIGTKG